jgi:ubiquinone/menaquinone biosynthesis C-methylase UbiE
MTRSNPHRILMAMSRRTGSPGALMERAALARIKELVQLQKRGIVMRQVKERPAAANRRFKSGVRQMWALGDYHAFATQTVWPVGPLLVHACGIATGQRVLDVAAGTGNTAIRAAQTGASVIASDLTPENFEAGRRAAAAHGVSLEWVEADVEALPFDDNTFDVVTSSFGAIFAPDHGAVASEMVRVCRPGGVIGITAFKPEGVAKDFFELIGRYAPPLPPGGQPPLLWGDEAHIQELFGHRVDSIEMRSGEYAERNSEGPDGYRRLFETTFGPIIGLREMLAAEPGRLTSFDREFREFTVRGNHGSPEGPAEYPYRYLLVIAHKRAR